MRVVTSGILMVCGACIALGIIHLRFWLMERIRRDHLAFALVCLSVAAYASFELLMMQAATPADYLFYARLSHIPGASMLISTAWFAYLNLHGRRWLFWTYCALRLLVLALNFIFPNGINFREVKAVGHIVLFGENLGYPIVVPNPWMLLAQLTHAILIIYCLDSSVRTWRRGERRKALAFGTGVFLFGATVFVCSIGVLWGLITLPIVVSLSIFFLVAAMVYELNHDMQISSILSKKLS